MWCWKRNWAVNGCWKNWKTTRCRGFANLEFVAHHHQCVIALLC
jgi:hypothetical protein